MRDTDRGRLQGPGAWSWTPTPNILPRFFAVEVRADGTVLSSWCRGRRALDLRTRSWDPAD